MNNGKYYILRRYYPYVDGFDDNDEIVYITKDYEDALKTAAWIHKADLERNESDDDYDDLYSVITIESFNNENIYKQYEEKIIPYCVSGTVCDDRSNESKGQAKKGCYFRTGFRSEKSRNRCRMQRRYSDIYGRSGNLKRAEVCKRAD